MDIPIEEQVEEWLKDNPDCSRYIRDWLRRPANVMPYVTEKNKLDYMRSHKFVKQLVEEMAKPHEVTKVNSIQEAIEITTKDMNKGQKPS